LRRSKTVAFYVAFECTSFVMALGGSCLLDARLCEITRVPL